MIALLLALALVAGAQTPDVLARDPAALPAAAAERWADWDPDVAPEGELRDGFVAAVRPYLAGHLPASLAALYELLERAPDYPPAWHQMGVVYFRLRRYGDAATAFERFLRVAPDEVAKTRAYAHSLYSLGRYEEAAAAYARILAAAPGMVEALRGAALTRLRLGDDEGALAGLERVLDIAPDHVEAWTWKARVLFDLERTEDSLAAARKARDLDPYDARPWFQLAQAHFDLGQDEEGEAARARFLELDAIAQETRLLDARLLYDPARPDLLLALVDAHRRALDASRARKALERLTRLDPARFEWRAHALEVLEGLGSAEGAAWAAQALETHCAEVADAWKLLQGYYGRRKDRVRQVRAGERFLRLGGVPD